MNSIDKAVEVLQNGGIILTPTDTTFGLSCLVSQKEAMDKIFNIKRRTKDKKFILLVENEGRLQRTVEVPELAWDLMDFNEKPLTLIYDRPINLPAHVLAEDGTVGIRVVDFLLLKKIISKVKEPIISTSVNFSGEKPPQRYEDIAPEILEEVDFILPETKTFTPHLDGSTIIQLHTDGRIKVIRE